MRAYVYQSVVDFRPFPLNREVPPGQIDRIVVLPLLCNNDRKAFICIVYLNKETPHSLAVKLRFTEGVIHSATYFSCSAASSSSVRGLSGRVST